MHEFFALTNHTLDVVDDNTQVQYIEQKHFILFSILSLTNHLKLSKECESVINWLLFLPYFFVAVLFQLQALTHSIS